MPMKIHENVLVFNSGTYNPIMTKGQKRTKGGGFSKIWDVNLLQTKNDNYFPRSIQSFSNGQRKDIEHPTQKPVSLYSYLIQTYSNSNDIILDFCCGSGTALVAAKQLGRHFIGIDISPEYCKLAEKRVLGANVPLFV